MTPKGRTKQIPNKHKGTQQNDTQNMRYLR